MTDRSDKFSWNSPDDIEILGPDGKPKEKKTETPVEPEVKHDRSDRFSWGPQDITILDKFGNPKK